MLDNHDLPADIGSQLQQLQLAAEHYHVCAAILTNTNDATPNSITRRLREQINGYHKARWQLAEHDSTHFERLLMGPEGRSFHYVSEAKVPEIFNNKKPCACAICHKEQAQTLNYWVFPNRLVICATCIATGQTERYNGSNHPVLFHPLEKFADNPIIPFYQVYLLAARTPPIGSFSRNQESYRWARHCGDFALYLGDINPEEIPYDALEKLANDDDCDAYDVANILEWYGSPYDTTCIHQFECLSCKKTLYTFDYQL